MRKINWYEYTYLLNDKYYLTISLIWDYDKYFDNYTTTTNIFDKHIKDILKNKYIYINKTHYEFDYNNIPISSSIIYKTEIFHIQPRVSERVLKSKYYFDYIWQENFKMDTCEEHSIDRLIFLNNQSWTT